MNRTLFLGGFLLFLPGFFGAAVSADTVPYENSASGFSIMPPAGWEKVPDAILQKTADMMFKDKNHPQWVVAFQRTGHTSLSYPYIIVQVVPYTGGKNPSEADLEKTVKTMTNQPVNKIKEMASDKANKMLGDISVGSATYDAENHSFAYSLSMDVTGAGKIRATSYGFFGQRSVWALNCYSLEGEAPSFQTDFSKCAGSFKFAPGFEYHPPEDDTALRSGLIGGLVGGAVALVFALRKRAKNRAAVRAAENPIDPTPPAGA